MTAWHFVGIAFYLALCLTIAVYGFEYIRVRRAASGALKRLMQIVRQQEGRE